MSDDRLDGCMIIPDAKSIVLEQHTAHKQDVAKWNASIGRVVNMISSFHAGCHRVRFSKNTPSLSFLVYGAASLLSSRE